jgi:tRNA/tmRNA/rRNA uracil-C5-methylase (TrmA/RlmC/RlmD family)
MLEQTAQGQTSNRMPAYAGGGAFTLRFATMVKQVLRL